MVKRIILLNLGLIPGLNTVFCQCFPFKDGYLYEVISPEINDIMTSNLDNSSNRYTFISLCNFMVVELRKICSLSSSS